MLSLIHISFFYRTDLIETPPTNCTELYETAKAVATDDMYGFAMAGEGEDGVFQFLPFLWSAGADLDNVAAPGGVEALDLLSKMIDEGLMSKDTVTNSQEDARVLFETGRAAMMLNLSLIHILILPLAFLLTALMGVSGVWLALPATEGAVSILSLALLIKIKKPY